MEDLKGAVEALLREEYPGSRLFWEEDSALSRPGGTLIWSGFADMSQIDRQKHVSDLLRGRLGARKTGLGIIFALTPEERDAVREAA